MLGEVFAECVDHTEYLTSASLSYSWNDKVGTHYEVAAQFGGASGDVVVLSTGVTYKLSKNV